MRESKKQPQDTRTLDQLWIDGDLIQAVKDFKKVIREEQKFLDEHYPKHPSLKSQPKD